jgi:DNA-binding NarL/FixJ family response regulator
VEVLGRYSNQVDQGERIQAILKMAPQGAPHPNPRTEKRVCRRLDPEEVDQLVADYAAGVPISQLTETFNVDQRTVQKRVREAGLPRRSERLSQRQVEDAIRLYEAGRSTEFIARELDRGPTTVRRALLRAGVTLRTRGRLGRS